MRVFVQKNLITVLLIASFLGISVAHVYMMGDINMTEHACYGVAAGNQDCPPSSEGASAFTFHLNALESFLQVIPQHLNGAVFLMFASSILFGLLSLFVLLYEAVKAISFLSRLKSFWRRNNAFHHKIGYWLTLLEKRDPAPHFLWRRVEFAMVPAS